MMLPEVGFVEVLKRRGDLEAPSPCRLPHTVGSTRACATDPRQLEMGRRVALSTEYLKHLLRSLSHGSRKAAFHASMGLEFEASR